MDDEYSFDFGKKNEINETNETIEADWDSIFYAKDLTEDEKEIVFLIVREPAITQKRLHEQTKISMGTIKRIIPELQKKGIIKREGNNRSGKWIVNKAK